MQNLKFQTVVKFFSCLGDPQMNQKLCQNYIYATDKWEKNL